MAEAIALFILAPVATVLLERGSHHCIDLLLEKDFLSAQAKERLLKWKKMLPTGRRKGLVGEAEAEKQLKAEVAAEKQRYADAVTSVESKLDAALRDKLHIAMDASALSQYRRESRASLGEEAYVVAVLGLSGRGKTTLIQNYLSYIGRACECLRAV
jgi:hypothetical protein